MTAGTRWRIGNAYAEITTNTPEKACRPKHTAPADVMHRAVVPCVISVADTKKHYRIVDFKRKKRYRS